MQKKRYNTEDIIHTLREADVLISQGKMVLEVCKHPGVSDQTYYSLGLPGCGTVDWIRMRIICS